MAKHGNRAVSGKSGSADLLEAAGIYLNLTPVQVARCIDNVGIGFMFAQTHHSAMKHAAGPRRELGLRTLFNMLGPLTNPAGVKHQVVGVFNQALCRPLAEVLQRLGSKHVLVVHSQDGLDEFSIGAPTRVAELRNDTVRTCPPSSRNSSACSAVTSAGLKVADAVASLAMIRKVFAGEPGAASDIVALDAGAAIYVAGLADSLAAGVHRAQDVIGSGAAQAKFDALVELSQRLSVG